MWFRISDRRAEINCLRSVGSHTGSGSELPGNPLRTSASPQVSVKNTSPTSPKRLLGMAKIKQLASSPRTRQWQRWKANSQVFLIPVSCRKEINTTFLGQEDRLSCVLALGYLLSPSSPALRPSKQPRHLLILDRAFKENKGEMLLLYLRS